MALLVLTSIELRPQGDFEAGRLGLALAMLPATFFLPPGIVFFYGFSRLWSRARDLRSELDLGRSSGRNGAFLTETAANFLLLMGGTGNALFLVWLLSLWMR